MPKTFTKSIKTSIKISIRKELPRNKSRYFSTVSHANRTGENGWPGRESWWVYAKQPRTISTLKRAVVGTSVASPLRPYKPSQQTRKQHNSGGGSRWDVRPISGFFVPVFRTPHFYYMPLPVVAVVVVVVFVRSSWPKH